MRKFLFQLLILGMLVMLSQTVFSQQKAKLSQSLIPPGWEEVRPEEIKHLTSIHVKVKVNVSGDKAIKNLVESYIKRELRELSDVSVVESNADWIIEIVAAEVENKARMKVGVVLSTVILKTVVDKDREITATYLAKLSYKLAQKLKNLQPAKSEKYGKQIYELTAIRWNLGKIAMGLIDGLYEYKDHKLQVGAPTDLKRICRKIVADFDTTFLEPQRHLGEPAKK